MPPTVPVLLDVAKQTVGGRSIPIIFGLEGGLAILVCGLVLFFVGWRQRRAERDVTRIPWVSPLLKTVAGSFLAVYGVINILVVFLAS